MKYLFLFPIVLMSILSYGQKCANITQNNLHIVYKKFETSGLKVIHKKSGIDYMEYAIDNFFDPQILNQLRIDTQYDIHVNGSDFTYERFKRRHFYIDKNTYLQYACYLEILSYLNLKLKGAR